MQFLFRVLRKHNMIAYEIGSRLYLNITNKCTCACRFCVRNLSPGVAGYDLRLEKEPNFDEIISAIGDPHAYLEIVFCGYGEPLIRLDTVKAVASWVKAQGIPVRVDTNGLANLFHGRNILPELEGLVDAVSISLNAENAEKYNTICRPVFGAQSYPALLEFIAESIKYIPRVRVSVVDIPEVDIEACREIADRMGVGFKVRHYDPDKY
jgi:TatD DNase family protein